jgi:hypothetical protein
VIPPPGAFIKMSVYAILGVRGCLEASPKDVPRLDSHAGHEQCKGTIKDTFPKADHSNMNQPI